MTRANEALLEQQEQLLEDIDTLQRDRAEVLTRLHEQTDQMQSAQVCVCVCVRAQACLSCTRVAVHNTHSTCTCWTRLCRA